MPQKPNARRDRLTTRRISFEPLAARNKSQEATRIISSPARQNSSPPSRVLSSALSLANERAEIALGTVRLRDEQIRRLRDVSQDQQRETETNRELVTAYIDRHREASAESNEWQNQCDKALKLANHWKVEAEAQYSRAQQLQQETAEVLGRGQLLVKELSAAQERCDRLEEEKAAVQYELALARYQIDILSRQRDDCLDALQLAQHECKILRSQQEAPLQATQMHIPLKQKQDSLEALQMAQNEIMTLRAEKQRLSDSLESIRQDYEVLLNNKVAKFIEDPTPQDAFSIKPNGMRSLQSALEQSQRGHNAERQLHSRAFELAQHYKQESNNLQEQNRMLEEKVAMLEELDGHRSMHEKHLAMIKELFFAEKLTNEESVVAELIKTLTKEVMEQKVSLETLGRFMHENADLKQALHEQQLQHVDELSATRAELQKIQQKYSSRDSEVLKNALEAETSRQEVHMASKRVVGLTEERDYWRNQSILSLQDKEQALFSTMEERLAFYKYMAQNQQGQIESLAWDLVMMRDWANEEVSNAGIYIEQREWYKAQVEAFEAQFAKHLDDFPLQMPFRPVWKTLSEAEQQELQKEELGRENIKYDAYWTVRKAYLNTQPSDYDVLADQVAKEASSLHGQAETGPAQLPEEAAGEEDPAEEVEATLGFDQEEKKGSAVSKLAVAPLNWAPVVPNLPSLLGKQLRGTEAPHDPENSIIRDDASEDGHVDVGAGRDSWDTVEGDVGGHPWNDPWVFSLLEEDE